MVKLKLTFNAVLSLLLLILTTLKFKVTGKNVGARHLTKTFSLFGGLPGSVASKFLAIKSNRELKRNRSEKFASGVSVSEASKLLDKKGFFLESNFLDKTITEEVLRYSMSSSGSFRENDTGQGNLPNVKFNRRSPVSVRFDYDPTTVLQCKAIQKVLANETVLCLAQEYLKGEPILDFVAMWWHTESKQPDKRAAQLFHYDMDRLRWVKFFFYVTDVKSENGPHVFIESTHQDYGIPFSLRRKGYTRLKDEEVQRVLPKERWIEFTGSAGTMIAEDTRGLHKGAHVRSGDRLLFQFQYTTALYGKAEEPDRMELQEFELTEELRVAINRYPNIFQKIRIR